MKVELIKDRIKFIWHFWEFEIYWPSVGYKKCWGLWFPTLIVLRNDGLWIYDWAFAFKIFGFGFGVTLKNLKKNGPLA